MECPPVSPRADKEKCVGWGWGVYVTEHALGSTATNKNQEGQEVGRKYHSEQSVIFDNEPETYRMGERKETNSFSLILPSFWNMPNLLPCLPNQAAARGQMSPFYGADMG